MIEQTPNYFPNTLDIAENKVNFLSISEDTYNNVSFLDERYLNEYGPGFWLPWDEVAAAASALTTSSDFIFHIGHTGSTLLSRLLSVTGEVLPVREPSVLRALFWLNSIDNAGGPIRTEQASSDVLGVFLRLLGRTYRAEQRSLIKPTSFVSVLAPAMLSISPQSKAVLLFIKPESYLATILSSTSSRNEARMNAPLRLANIHRRLGAAHWCLDEMREGEIVAMSWIGGIMALADTAAQHPDRIIWVNFERLLRNPREVLSTIGSQLRGPGSDWRVDDMLRSPYLQKYSKNPNRRYDISDRGRAISWSNENHAKEISDGMAWIDEFESLQPAWGAWTSMVRSM